MTTELTKAAQQALEALDEIHAGKRHPQLALAVAHNLRRALAQRPAAQEVAAVKTLETLGYTYHEGELWKPPLGKRPAAQTEREAFERWATNDGAWPDNIARSVESPDEYAINEIQQAWLAVQATTSRASLPAPQQATPEPVGEPVAWRWMPSHVFPTWVYSDDQNRVADARRFMGDGGVQALYTHPAPGVPEGWRDAKNDPPPVGVDVLVAVEFDGPGDWRIKVGGRNPQERTGWCVFGASWVPQVWMPLDAHRAALAAAQAKGGEHE